MDWTRMRVDPDAPSLENRLVEGQPKSRPSEIRASPAGWGSVLIVLQRVPFQLPDEVADIFTAAQLRLEQRLQQRREMHAQRHRQDRRRVGLQSHDDVVELVETLLDRGIAARVCQ